MFNQKEYMEKWQKNNPEYRKEYRINNQERIKKNMEQWHIDKKEHEKQYRKDHKEEKIEYDRQYYQENKEKILECSKRCGMKRKYDLSQKEWEGLWYAQDGRCVICDKFFIEKRDICIDHDHETGKIRGLLCRRCNFGLGYFDNSELLIKANEYLKRM